MRQFVTGQSLVWLTLLAVAFVTPVHAQEEAKQQPAAEQAEKEPAKDDEAKPDPNAAFAKALDELESEIRQQESMAKYGPAEIRDFATDLENEYRHNEESLREPPQDDLDAGRLEKLRKRQKLISLYLWELERVGPTIAQVDTASRALTTRLHKLLREHRDAMKNAALMNRYHMLSRRTHQLTIQRMRMRGSNRFYFRSATSEDDAEVADSNAPKNDSQLKSGPIQKLRRPLQKILKLRWSEGDLVLDREHWKEPFAGKTLAEISSDVQSMLKERGVKLPKDGSKAALIRARGRTNQEPIALLFQNLMHQATPTGGNLSTSSGGGGSNLQMKFSTPNLSSSLTRRDQLLDLTMTESAAPDRTFRITGDTTRLRFSLLGDQIVLLDQKPDADVRLVMVTDKPPISLTAPSFAQLYAEHPEVVEDQFFPLLDHLGFVLPPTRFSPQVIERVVADIRVIDQATQVEFERLLAKTNSSSFQKRAQATRDLEVGLSRYRKLITEAYRNEELSTEVKTRLKHVLKRYDIEQRELDALAVKMGLKENASYLISLLGRVEGESQVVVIAHLKQLTDQDFGSDTAKWEQWLANRE